MGTRLRPTYEMLDEATGESAGGKERMDAEALVERIKSEFDAEEVS
jgi:hypothetical protein